MTPEHRSCEGEAEATSPCSRAASQDPALITEKSEASEADPHRVSDAPAETPPFVAGEGERCARRWTATPLAVTAVTTPENAEEVAKSSSPPSPASPVSAPGPTTGANAKVVFNLAGVSIPAYLAESSDPPPVFSRANKSRRNRRRKQFTADNAVFQQHQLLREDPQLYNTFFQRAPIATEADVLRSLNEFTDSPALVYAELLWRYTPEAIASLSMLRTRRHLSAATASGDGCLKHERLKVEDDLQ